VHKQKIVVVTNLYPNSLEPTRGTFVKQLVARLASRYEIVVIAPLPWRPGWPGKSKVSSTERIDGIEIFHPRYLVIPKILRATYGISLFLRIFPLLRRLKKEGRCDFISAHWLYPDGVASTMAARLLQLPVYVHAMGCDINEYAKFHLRRIQIVRAMRSANAVITKSAALASRVQELGIAPANINVVPNGIDRHRFLPGDKQEARRALEIPADIFSFLYIGNFNQEKNVSLLIRAFAKAVENMSLPAHLYLVGDGPEREKLEGLVTNLAIRSRVTFAGRQSHQMLRTYYQAADCFALPSLREGCPNVLLEALACGLPVIASRVGGVPEIVTAGRGALIESGNLEEWCRAVTEALANPPERVSNFQWPSWEDNATALEQIFAERNNCLDEGVGL